MDKKCLNELTDRLEYWCIIDSLEKINRCMIDRWIERIDIRCIINRWIDRWMYIYANR